MGRNVRRNEVRLQPHIIVNNRAQLPEDFGTPEEQVDPRRKGARGRRA